MFNFLSRAAHVQLLFTMPASRAVDKDILIQCRMLLKLTIYGSHSDITLQECVLQLAVAHYLSILFVTVIQHQHQAALIVQPSTLQARLSDSDFLE